MGETGDSGQNPGSDGDGKMATIPNEFRESSWRVSRIPIRLIMGDFFPVGGLFSESMGHPVFL
jgi:hypothetical protein